MTPDPRWLEILKASGQQTAAVAIACGLILWADRAGWLPALDPWMIQLAAVAMLICGLLAIASFVGGAITHIGKWSANFSKSRALRHSIDTLNQDERQFLEAQIDKGEATEYLQPFTAGGIPNFVRLSNMYRGLEEKGIVEVTAADPQGKIQSIRVKQSAWNLLMKRRKK
jgi:hypothetical protein